MPGPALDPASHARQHLVWQMAVQTQSQVTAPHWECRSAEAISGVWKGAGAECAHLGQHCKGIPSFCILWLKIGP